MKRDSTALAEIKKWCPRPDFHLCHAGSKTACVEIRPAPARSGLTAKGLGYSAGATRIDQAAAPVRDPLGDGCYAAFLGPHPGDRASAPTAPPSRRPLGSEPPGYPRRAHADHGPDPGARGELASHAGGQLAASPGKGGGNPIRHRRRRRGGYPSVLAAQLSMRAASTAESAPSTSNTLVRARAPDSSLTEPWPTPKASVSASATARLARPSSAGAVTRTTSPPSP